MVWINSSSFCYAGVFIQILAATAAIHQMVGNNNQGKGMPLLYVMHFILSIIPLAIFTLSYRYKVYEQVLDVVD